MMCLFHEYYARIKKLSTVHTTWNEIRKEKGKKKLWKEKGEKKFILKKKNN